MPGLEQARKRLEGLVDAAFERHYAQAQFLSDNNQLRKRFFIALADAGFKGPREDRLQLLRLITGNNDLATSNDLPADVARAIIAFVPDFSPETSQAANVFKGLLDGTLALWGDAPMDGQPQLDLGDLIANGTITKGAANVPAKQRQEANTMEQQENYEAGTQKTNGMAYEEQVEALGALVDNWAIKSSKNVKGSYTTGEYVEYQLRRIFGPDNWSLTILDGPKIIDLSASEAYARVTCRLQVNFANGTQTHQDAIGVWPLKATRAREGGTLENTAAERFETVLKAACTDALKAAAERIGSCFRPLSDLELQGHIKRTAFRADGHVPPDAETAAKELYGTGPPKQAEVDPGLIASFDEFCSAAIIHLGYADSDTVIEALQRLTGGASAGLTYVGMWKLLTDHRAAVEAKSDG